MINNVTTNHTKGMTPNSANLVESTNVESDVYQACGIESRVDNTPNSNSGLALSDRSVASPVDSNNTLEASLIEVLNKKYPNSGIEIMGYEGLISKYRGHKEVARIQYIEDNKEHILQDISNILSKFPGIVINNRLKWDDTKVGDIRHCRLSKYLFGMVISVWMKINATEAVSVIHQRGESEICGGERSCPHTHAFYLLGKDDEETYKKLICDSYGIIIHSALTGILGLADKCTNVYIDNIDIIKNILVIYDRSKERYISVKLDAIYDFNTGIFNIQKLQNILYDLSNSDTDLSKDLFERLLPCDFVPLDEVSATKKLDARVVQQGYCMAQALGYMSQEGFIQGSGDMHSEIGCKEYLEPPKDREEYNRYLIRLKEVNQLVENDENFNLKDLVGGGILDDIPRVNTET